MNARKEIKDALLLRRMRHWLAIACCPLVDRRVPAWRARKNYWALVRRHPALAAEHGFTVTSVL